MAEIKSKLLFPVKKSKDYVLNPRAMEAGLIFQTTGISRHSVHPIACNSSTIQVIQQIDAAE